MIDRVALEARWLDLTRAALPSVATTRRWPITADHCFQRVFLDVATGGVWYDAIAGRPAYACAPDLILAEAVRLAEAVLAGEADLDKLNERSLGWRRARKRAR